jgi:hypothetical protein
MIRGRRVLFLRYGRWDRYICSPRIRNDRSARKENGNSRAHAWNSKCARERVQCTCRMILEAFCMQLAAYVACECTADISGLPVALSFLSSFRGRPSMRAATVAILEKAEGTATVNRRADYLSEPRRVYDRAPRVSAVAGIFLTARATNYPPASPFPSLEGDASPVALPCRVR